MASHRASIPGSHQCACSFTTFLSTTEPRERHQRGNVALSCGQIAREIHGAIGVSGQSLRGIRGASHVAIAFPPDRIHRGQAGIQKSPRIFPRATSWSAKITQLIIG